MHVFRPASKSSKLLQLQALLPRLHEKSPNFDHLHDLLGKELAGYYGETSLQYYFQLLHLPTSILLYGLRLPGEHNAFQIDALLLTPTVIFIIEAKNIKGIVTFNEAGQLIRSLDGIKETYAHPLLQANEQRLHLKKFLVSHNFNDIAVHPIVCFTHSNVILDFEHQQTDVLTSEQLPNRIRELTNQYKMKKLDRRQLQTVARVLQAHHTDFRGKIIEKYNIPKRHIRKGVWCPSCKRDTMQRYKRTWICPSCGSRDSYAHRQALTEYGLLFKTSIKNSEAREFLAVESSSVVKRMLTGMGLNYSGENYKRTYYLNELLK
ncbi:nuclease-related domain-containing protein [Paraliobacillus ryukyuensis]|uniref:nuclease-related domain-containing protein n=1 Tax=Paraliobacillus ryukyuensis TaxID=200904 RepID=UPI0009A6BB01|nr:nuclease-related domain-containing protein [Paraliobacillus ryukyuensis]